MKDEIYQFSNLLSYPKLKHGISTKSFGSMKKEDGEINYENLEYFRTKLGIKERAVTMQQIHSGNVSIVRDASNLRIADTDALVTNKKGIPLIVLTADCLPILLFDPKKEVIGLVHAGYRGLLNRIIEHTIDRMKSEFGTDSKDIIVGIGPAIEQRCYEVGEEVIAKFTDAFPSFQNIFIKKDEKYFLNLREIALQSLLKEGITKDHIEVADVCTKCDDRFYSYRGGDKNGRFGSIICLR